MMVKQFSMELAGRTLTVEIGKVAAQANGEEDRKVPACSEDFFHGSRLLKFRKQVIFGYRSLKVPSGFLNRLYMSIIMFTNHETFLQ